MPRGRRHLVSTGVSLVQGGLAIIGAIVTSKWLWNKFKGKKCKAHQEPVISEHQPEDIQKNIFNSEIEEKLLCPIT